MSPFRCERVGGVVGRTYDLRRCKPTTENVAAVVGVLLDCLFVSEVEAL